LNWKTSQSDPLRVAEITLSGNVKIGISFCPGKTQLEAYSGAWKRDLAIDLEVIHSLNYDVVLSLIEDFEFQQLRVEGLQSEAMRDSGMDWLWSPIVDQSTPTPANYTVLMDALQRVEAGDSIFVHCKGGLGRAGTIAAWMLTHFGRSSHEAIAEVRSVRPGAIENCDQEDWIAMNAGQRFTQSLRIFTLNVYNPKSGSIELDNIFRIINESEAEIIVLTECGQEAFQELEERLRCNDAAYADADYWGNGILTRTLNLRNCGCVKLSHWPSEVRSAVVAEISLSKFTTIRLIGTHLEVSDEASRLEQVSLLDELIGLSDSILVGDFNSLTESDYHTEAMESLIQTREKANKSPPRWNVMNQLIAHHGMLDTGKSQEFQATTLYGTRVDYILLGESCGLKFKPDSYRVINCIDPNTTDHNAVMVDLELIGVNGSK
jgi:protein-tyrosine phosphatase/endonuclease/exonuclease/phosphatase family metal-dependent hydrolase